MINRENEEVHPFEYPSRQAPEKQKGFLDSLPSLGLYRTRTQAEEFEILYASTGRRCTLRSGSNAPRRYLQTQVRIIGDGIPGNAMPRLPEIVAAADWSVRVGGRSLAIAGLRPDGKSYEIENRPEAISSPSCVMERLSPRRSSQGVTLVGFDFPIGLPRAYALAAGIKGFREGLALFDSAPEWNQFYVPTDEPGPHQPFAPANSNSRLKRAELSEAIGLSSESDLLRQCDRRTATRYQAESVFYLRFAKQVGRSAIQGWRDVLGPIRSQIRIWPFDGALDKLLSVPGIVVVEIYPAEAATHLALPLGPGTGRSKRRREDRAQTCQVLLAKVESARITLSPDVRALLTSGCDSEHDFDSLVSLVSMIQVLQGTRTADTPNDDLVRNTEGWILGQDPSPYVPPKAARAHIPKFESSRPGQDPYVIHRVWCGPVSAKHLMELAYPIGDGKGTVNVVCGPNNSGKSFLLGQIYRIVKRKKDRGVIRVEPIPSRQPRVLFLGKTWTDKDKIGTVNLDQTAGALSVGGQHGDYLRSGLSFLLKQMAPHLAGVHAEDLAESVIEPDVRDQIKKVFEVEHQVYSCNANDPLVQRLERVLGGNLYFRCVKREENAYAWQFEFVLVYGNGTTLPYEMWSDGQRAFFYVSVSLEYFQPEIVLYDEAENHLHPAFMSQILEELRAFPAQSLIATHHPHLIFSRFADRVYYIETTRPKPHPTPPARLPFSAQYIDFERRVEELRGSFEKISSSYKLFTHQDAQLLAQAEYVLTRSTLILVEALSSIFSYPPVPEGAKPLPDSQTQQLADRIRTFARTREKKAIEILDLGAGLGRQIAELAKLSNWQLGTGVNWTCFEPMEPSRSMLQARFSRARNVSVIGDLSTLSATKFDFCVLANVLHELTPPEFANYLTKADQHARYDSGGIVILELFPLLHPESHAVPYPPASLQGILNKADFSVDLAQISLAQSGATAYCLLARRGASAIKRGRVQAIVERAWQQLLDLSLSAYSLRSIQNDLAGYQTLLSHLTTIASITSWTAGKWHPLWSEATSRPRKKRSSI